MTDLILEFLYGLINLIENSVYMGPDGTIYEIVLLVSYGAFQFMMVGEKAFFEKLPKRSTLGIVLMVLLFLPGILVRLLLEKCVNIILKSMKKITFLWVNRKYFAKKIKELAKGVIYARK